MIRLSEYERKAIQRQNAVARLKRASGSKGAGGKTYYILSDDVISLKILASLRGSTVAQLRQQ